MMTKIRFASVAAKQFRKTIKRIRMFCRQRKFIRRLNQANLNPCRPHIRQNLFLINRRRILISKFHIRKLPQKSSKGLIIAVLGIGILVILGAIGAGGYYFWQQQQNQQQPQTAEVLPDHLGMFVQNAEKTAGDEIKKLDVTNAYRTKKKNF